MPENVSFLEADITDLDGLKVGVPMPYYKIAFLGRKLIVSKSAATETARLTGGGLDYLINNAALISNTSRYRTLGDL